MAAMSVIVFRKRGNDLGRESQSISKISRPKLARVYQRRRLFRLLDQGSERPVIWVSAPAGSGKTTLVNSYLDSRKLPCLWYQVDEGDADIAAFFYYLGLAAKNAAPRPKRPLPLLTPEYGLGIPTFTRRFFENLCSRLKPPFFLVFDNYQTAPQASPFHEIMNLGLSGLPEGIHAIVISRTDPPPILTSLIANNKLSMIGWEELRLAPEESKGIAWMESGETLSAQTVSQMHEHAQGWAAGLILLSRGAKAKDAASEPHCTFDPARIFDYFASELFDRTERTVQDFLFKTAFLPQITVSIAEKITGNRHAGRILSDLNRSNYFTERRQGREVIYQYHPLFREFLLDRAEKTVPKKEASSILRTAAELLEKAGEIEDAAELHIRAGNAIGLANVIKAHASALAAQGRERTLSEWLASVPGDVLESNPWLLYWMGVCRMPYAPAEAGNLFEGAFSRFRTQKDAAGVFLSWAGIAESIWFSFDDMSRLGRWINMLSLIIRKFRKFPSREIEAQVASVMLKALQTRRLDHPDFAVWEKRALSSDDTNTRIYALVNIVNHYIFCGDIFKAGESMHSLRTLLKTPAESSLQRLTGKLQEVLLSVLNGNSESGVETAEEALQMADASGVHVLDFPLLGNGLVAAFNSGKRAAVRSLTARMPSHPDELRAWDKGFYHFLTAVERMAGGDHSRALEHAEKGLHYADQVQIPASCIWSRYTKALILYELGKYEQAERILEQGFRISLDAGSDLTRYEYFLIKSYFALHRGKEAACRKYLRQALKLGKEKGLISTFIPIREISTKLCMKALESGIETEYTREIIRKRKLLPEDPPLHIENWPWQVKISTLGRFTLEVDEKPVWFSGKVQKKPLEMLKALIAFGGRDVGVEQIADALWPDSEGDKTRKTFEITLHRLRKLIANDNAVQVKDGRVSLDPRYCWVDAWAFEQMLESVELGVHSSELKSQKRKYAVRNSQFEIEKVISLYNGHFLPADSRELWTMSMRERLRSKFLRLVTFQGSELMVAKQYEKALECFQQGLEIDDLAEEFYRQLMRCYHHLGQETEAVKVFNRCRAALSGAFGIEPSSKTEEIYRSLRNR